MNPRVAKHAEALAKFSPNLILAEARDVIHMTFDQLGYSNLKANVNVNWNNRLARTAGYAKGMRAIELNPKFYAIVDEKERIETSVHEACHIAATYERYQEDKARLERWRITGKLDASQRRERHHGPRWKQMMYKAGYPNAERCHTIDMSAFGRVKKVYHYDCACGRTLKLSAQKVGMIRNRTRYYQCKGCVRPIEATAYFRQVNLV